MEDNERTFTELIRSNDGRRSEVKELIKAQEKAAVSQAEGLLKQLEQEIAKLRRRDAELEQLSHTEDHIHFLQVTSLVSLSTAAGVTAESDRFSCSQYDPLPIGPTPNPSMFARSVQWKLHHYTAYTYTDPSGILTSRS